MVESSFGLFTVNDGVGPARAAVNGQRLTLTNPARPGDEVTLEGTGLGRAGIGSSRLFWSAGIRFRSPASTQESRLVWTGCTSLLPDDAAIPDGCYERIAVAAGGNVSNSATIPTARSGSACAHPFGLSLDEMRTLKTPAAS